MENSPKLAKGIMARVLNTQLAVEFGIRTELNASLMKPNDFAPYMEHLAKMNPLYFVRTLDSLKDHSAWDHLPTSTCPPWWSAVKAIASRPSG